MIGEDQKELPSTQTQTQTQTQNSVYVLENNENLPQRVTWGQLFTKSITIHDNGRKFVVFENPQQFNLTEEHWSAGRMDTLEFVFKSHHLTPAMLGRVSKVHFRLSRELEHPLRPVFIEDHSRNGTFVNGDLVGLNKKRILRTNDVISILNAEYKLFIFHDMMPDLSHNLPKMISRKYFVGSELGSGACGVVRLVYDIHSCQQFAMKQVVKMRLEDPGQKILNDPERIMNEVAIMKSLEHPCIVRMFDIYDRPESVFMILELMRGGDMISRISKMPQRRLPESSAKFFFVQMCEAIKYLHDKGITHRDIKPDNILLATEEEETLLKVTDFGLSKFVKKNSIMKTLCGTPQYVAPEILTTGGKGSYTKKVDIWSLGCCLYACLAGSVPFSGGVHGDIQDIANDIVRGTLKFDPTRWRSVSQRAIQVVTVCLTKNPGQRPSIEQLRSLEWMNDEAVIERVTRVMGRPVLQDVKEARRLHLQSSSRGRSVAKTVPVQMEVTTTRVQASNGRHLFVQPGVRQRINNIRGSTPPAVTVPRPQTTAPAREYQDEPPLKRSRYC